MYKYLKNEVIKYYHRIFDNGESPSIHKKQKLLRQIYAYLKKNNYKACQRRFPKEHNYGKKSKNKNVPKELTCFFNKLFNRLFIDGDGKVYFSKLDNMSFWAPSKSNNCKIHSNNCPLYCLKNTQNKEIILQRNNNFKIVHDNDRKLLEDERLHLWKRNELLKEKEKIFLCFNEAEHCTFEPKVNKTENDFNGLTAEDIVKKRLNNKTWVAKMGKNYIQTNPIIFKEGRCKMAKIAYNAGKFQDCIHILNKAFDLERLKAQFDKNYAIIYNKKIEKEKKEGNSQREFDYERRKPEVPPDNFKDNKNLEICIEVYSMIKDIDDFKNDRKKQAKKLIDELALIKKAKHDPEIRKKLNSKSLGKNDIYVSTKKTKHNEKTASKENVAASNINQTELNTDKPISESLQPINSRENNLIASNNDNNNILVESKLNDYNSVSGISNASTKNTFSLTIHQTNYINEKYFKCFKSIMCPLKSECPFDLRPRWPHSNLKANTPFGVGCNYAHHISELKFEQEMEQQIRLKEQNLKKLLKDEDPMIVDEWNPTGAIFSCNGCGKSYGLRKRGEKGGTKVCGFCRYTQHNDLMTDKERKEAERTNKIILEKINYKSSPPEEWDQSFEKKFGVLKKASVLYSFRRYVDSLEVIGEARNLVIKEQESNLKKFHDLDLRWRKKLEIEHLIIPREILNYEITEDTIKYFKIEGISLSTLLVYADKMRKGNDFSIFNRHTYLNNQILIYYDMVKKTINSYKVECKSIKNQINELNQWITKKEKLRTENPKLFKKYSNKYKIEMCPNIIKFGKCSESYLNCKFAHHPNILNLTQPETQIKLLGNNLEVTKNKLIQSKTIIPFVPAKRDRYEQSKFISFYL